MKSYAKCERSVWLVMVLVVLVTFFLNGMESPALGAGIPSTPESDENMGGSFYPSGFNSMPSFGSSSSDNGTQVYGSFWLSLDANASSLDYTNWSFYTNSDDTSYWTATCYLHGFRDSYTVWPQNKNWSQSYSGESGVSLSASTNLNCYDNQVLNLYGNFNISPSDLQSSSFNYEDTTDNLYSWPNGYDNEPVITQVPSWNAQFNMYGQFIAPTIEEARAMGAMFVQSVPEPSTFVLLVIGGFVGIAITAYRRKRKLN